MTLAQFIQTYQGKAIDFDGIPSDTGQCVQLVAEYCKQVLNAPVLYAPYAVDWWTEFSNSVLQSHFDKIARPALPKVGDIAVYGASNLINSPLAGHIDIVVANVTSSGYTGFDSNWGGVRASNGYPAAHDVQHTYTDVFGFLRLKSSATPVVQPEYYNVVRGDTVTGICAKFKKEYGLTLAIFEKLNPTITNINLIYVGERVRVR
jgi:hypothetical protein